MKKFFAIIMTLCLALSIALTATACNTADTDGSQQDTPKVAIRFAADAATALPLLLTGQVDFALLGEPAVSQAKTKGCTVVFDLQQLWQDATGSVNGYPQASLIIKKDIIDNNPGFVQALVAAMTADAEALPDNAAGILSELQAHGSSLSVTFTDQIVRNCNIKSVPAQSEKTAIATYLNEFNMTVKDDGLYYTPADAADSIAAQYTVYCPDGAPAIAFYGRMADGNKCGNVDLDINIVAGDEIVTKVASGEADIAILPTNAAAKMYNIGKPYQLVTTNVHGIMYIVTKNYTDATTLSDLCGHVIACIGQSNTGEYLLKYLLDKSNVSYVESDTAE